jgi:hypothetical protein
MKTKILAAIIIVSMILYCMPILLTNVGAISTASVTITSAPVGLVVAVDGTNYTTPQTFPAWIVGSTHTLTAYSPVPIAPGSQHAWASWSDLGAPTHNYTVVGPATVVAYYVVQYYLTVQASPAIVVPPGSGWYNASTPVGLTAPVVATYSFSYWDVDGISRGSYVNPIIVFMSAPHNATAHYFLTPLMQVVPSSVIFKDHIGTVFINETFTENVTISNITPDMQLVGFEFTLNYDPTLLGMVSIANGTFLESFAGPSDRGVLYYELPSPGSILVAGLIIPAANGSWDPSHYPNGNGTLAGITFQVISEPYDGVMSFANCTLKLFDNKLGAPGGIPIPNDAKSGFYSMAPVPEGDINFDGIVDIYDAVLFAGAFGSTPTSPHWNPIADFNNDNIIDIYDAILLARNFGAVRPDP